jgi:biotin carboxylase
MQMAAGRSHLVVVSSGGQPYREYALVALARGYQVSAVLSAPPTWQQPYLQDFAVAELSAPSAIAAAVAKLIGDTPQAGVLTWDETVLEATAQAAEKLNLPHMSADAAARCRDKYATRSSLAQAGLPAVRYRLVTSVPEAVSAAAEIGYPVVLKPRALAGSLGVVRADDAEAVRAAFATADSSRFADLPTGHGVLVEEFLDGPEISVDSVVADDNVQLVHVARKRLGYPPFFEEVGHLVTGWSAQPWADEVRELVVGAHRAIGVNRGVTHAEVRLTSAGPRLVELNGRLGGDLIPYASALATGIDLVTAAAELACGRTPQLPVAGEGAAEVRFVYPPSDCVVQEIDVAAAAAVPGIAYAVGLAGPGDTLLLPPRQVIPRLAALVAVGADERECGQVLDRAERAVTVRVEPLTA